MVVYKYRTIIIASTATCITIGFHYNYTALFEEQVIGFGTIGLQNLSETEKEKDRVGPAR